MCIVTFQFSKFESWLLTAEQIVELNNLMPEKHAFVLLKLFALGIALTYFFLGCIRCCQDKQADNSKL